ncbi:interleukin 15-like precursor [Oryctolagus cuniculus]|uniref:Interleukin 15-like n=1 Tax=Oryctolagus cuniculus TaxID=9986 RepID=G1TUY6_RABIT|nr:interleukin 15-like precursor [Oryctolagus cuniculus]AGI95568.1 interleukin 15-like protein [Oryctolagus cuniculus]
MWPLWTILLLGGLLGGLGTPLCRREPFYFLVAIMKILGDKNDGTLYTPDDLSVCPAETLGCFRLELAVIGFEEGPSVGIAVFRLQRLLDALGSRLWVASQGPCLPCEGHPQRPVPLFLAKLLELLQGACAQHLSTA